MIIKVNENFDEFRGFLINICNMLNFTRNWSKTRIEKPIPHQYMRVGFRGD